MAAKGITIFNSSLIGSSAGSAAFWSGGRAAFVVNAASYGPGLFLQFQGPSSAWININAVTYSADQVTTYDLPAGQYRVVNNSGNTVGMVAVISSVIYT